MIEPEGNFFTQVWHPGVESECMGWDGWHGMELEDVSKWMVSRFASDVEECVCHSAAVSFSRIYALSEHTVRAVGHAGRGRHGA